MLRFFFFFNDTATTEIYTLSLHDALPIFRRAGVDAARCRAAAGRRRLRRPHGAGLATAPGTGPVTAPDPAGEQRIRVVVATWGDDDADRATMSVARGLRDAGMEVVHAGRDRKSTRPELQSRQYLVC